MNHVGLSVTTRAACIRTAAFASPFVQLLHGSTIRARSLRPDLRITPPAGCWNYRSKASFSTSQYLAAPAKRNNAKPKRVVSRVVSSGRPHPVGPIKRTEEAKAAHVKDHPAPLLDDQSQDVDAEQVTAAQPSNPEDILTWRDYDPEGGMPLPQGELSAQVVRELFDGELDQDLGNYAVNVMNWRRQSGSLIDQGTKFRLNRITDEQALKALEYVRDAQPDFDEESAGFNWAEEESQRLREDMQERSVKLGIYKPSPEQEQELLEEAAEEEDEASKQGTPEGRKRSAESALLQERRRREAEWEEEQALKAQKEEQAQTAAIHASRGPLELSGGVQPGVAIATIEPKEVQAAQRLAKSKAWREEYAKKSDPFEKDAKVPEMSILARLGPAFCLTAAAVAFSILLASTYVIPPESARMFPDWPASYVTLGTLTAVLGFVFLLCRWPPFYATALKYLALYPPLPRAVSIIGAMFSHHGAKHLATNLVALWAVGSTFHEDVGRGTLLAVLLGCGALGGFTTLTHEVLRKNWNFYTMGASNAVLGMFAATCTLHPQRRFKILGYDVDVAVWLLLPLSLALDVAGLFTPLKLSIDFVGHIAGQLSGIAAGLYLRRIYVQQKTSLPGQDEQKR